MTETRSDDQQLEGQDTRSASRAEGPDPSSPEMENVVREAEERARRNVEGGKRDDQRNE